MKIHFTRYSIEKYFLVLLMFLVLMTWHTSVSALEIPLTIKEPAGIERKREPVTSGIPLPPGSQTANWSLWDGDNEIPVQNVTTQSQCIVAFSGFSSGRPCRRGGTKVLTLKDTQASGTHSDSISIFDDGIDIFVTTGPCNF